MIRTDALLEAAGLEEGRRQGLEAAEAPVNNLLDDGKRGLCPPTFGVDYVFLVLVSLTLIL
ncbi:hypothetical protein ACP70R_015398 [Stipagrostis hirtigluma subsp. patula]